MRAMVRLAVAGPLLLGGCSVSPDAALIPAGPGQEPDPMVIADGLDVDAGRPRQLTDSDTFFDRRLLQHDA